MVLGKLDRYMQKNETRPPSYTTHDNKFKMDQRLNIRPKTIKIVEENIGSKISDIACSNILSNISPQANKRQSKQMGLYQTNKKTAHRTREHIHQYI